MNAQGTKHQDHFDWLMANNNYVAQEKLDGMRTVVHVTKTGLRIFSRSAGVADPTRPLEKTSALPHLAALRFPGMHGVVLDAEILARGVDSAQLSGNIHRNEVVDENRTVKIFVFDVLRYGPRTLTTDTLQSRISFLDQLKPHFQSPSIEFLPWAFKAESKRKLYQDVLARDGEGIMLKRLDAFYFEGGRPANNWYKRKKSASFDCVVMGFTTGKGKYNNRIGAIIFGQYVKGKLLELGQASGMSDAERYLMSNNPEKYIGKVVIIKGMERLKSGAIRHPQYGGIRHDKNPKQCRWYQNEQ